MKKPAESVPERVIARHFSSQRTIWRVTISEAAWTTMVQHRQDHGQKSEAGGQLFGTISDGTYRVEVATAPSNWDIRTRMGFRPSRRHEQRDIERYFRKGLHFLGNWHTHPESRPSPSNMDLRSIAEEFKKSDHELPMFLLAIVGVDRGPKGLWLTGHSAVDMFLFRAGA